jgi:two-component system chemotaxis response regulator CheB
VLVIDDSALVRKLLAEILSSDPAIEVVGTAQDPYVARERIKQLNPDVLTLDVEMPRMDGITFLRNLMRLHPMPVVMVSSLTEKGAQVTLDALELGAVDFVTKPRVDLVNALDGYAQDILAKVKMAAGVRVRALAEREPSSAQSALRLTMSAAGAKAAGGSVLRTTDRVVAIGASTGGTEAIKDILVRLPADFPGVVITQHIPPAFSAAFARRMDSVSALTVREAADGEQILSGHAYVAPGGWHLRVERSGARYLCRIDDSAPVNRHRPSVDVLFRSVAQNVGPNALGVILTGMGDDGAHGLKEMRDAGAHTIAQDEKSSVVWGMPGEAVKLGAAEAVLPLDRIAGALLGRLAEGPATAIHTHAQAGPCAG